MHLNFLDTSPLSVSRQVYARIQIVYKCMHLSANVNAID